MSRSVNKETEEHSEVQSTLEDGGLHRGGVVGDLSTYRDHVVRLAEGMPGFEGFIPFFDVEEGMEAPTYLFQDPHKSGVEKSVVVSHTNNDASARMIPPQLEAPRDERVPRGSKRQRRGQSSGPILQAFRRAYRGPGGVRC